MPVSTVFDERGLETGFDADDLGEVDVALQMSLGGCLNVEILKLGTVQHHDAGFFRVRGVDQHALRHKVRNSEKPNGIRGPPKAGRAPDGG